MILGKKDSETFEGKLLLNLYRGEQKKQGNIGCNCNKCQKAMILAWKRFKAIVFEKYMGQSVRKNDST